MEIQITNFLGIEQVAIPLGVPVAVTGPNASGKTSLATACAGILAQNDNPLGLGATKRPYMRDSADSGEVLLTDEHGTIYRHWRLMEKGIRVLPDSPDSLSKHVLGLTNFIGIPPKHRVEAWESCFLPAPKELVSMVSSELEKQISRSAVLDEVLGLLRLRKWTDCEAVFSHKAREAKQEWQRIAGETWGSKKADGWTPTGWRSDLDAVTPAECRTRIEEAREALRLVQTGQAVHESEIERARQVAVEIPSIVKELNVRTEARNDAKIAYDAINDEVRAIRDNGLAVKTNLERHDRTQPIREQTVSCPACGEALVVGPNGTLARARDESAFESMESAWRVGRKKLADELERLRAVAREIVGTRLNPAKKVLVNAEERRSETASRLSAAKREAVTEGKRVITDDDQRRVAEAEQAVDEAKAARTARRPARGCAERAPERRELQRDRADARPEGDPQPGHAEAARRARRGARRHPEHLPVAAGPPRHVVLGHHRGPGRRRLVRVRAVAGQLHAAGGDRPGTRRAAPDRRWRGHPRRGRPRAVDRALRLAREPWRLPAAVRHRLAGRAARVVGNGRDHRRAVRVTQLLGGAANGTTLMLKRAPRFLRAVRNARGDVDALDQLDDEPQPDEQIIVYRLEGEVGSVHIQGARGRGRCGWYTTAQYRVVDPQPEDADVRETQPWRNWCTDQPNQGEGEKHDT